jgi:[ribosomal protein S5]-alanine N-acetyltransferase
MDAATVILATPRLELRELALSDAQFLVRLLNDPSWLENIGDRGVRSQRDAEDYLRSNIRAQYQAHGYGLYALQLKSTRLPIGICGLLRREFLPGADLGFALLPDFVGQGYASEAARAVMAYAQGKLGIARLYAIVSRGNHRSVRLLGQLGFRHQGPYSIPRGDEVELYVTA